MLCIRNIICSVVKLAKNFTCINFAFENFENFIQSYGLPIHACIDGFSRLVIWVKIEKSNNDTRVIEQLFINAIMHIEDCPTLVRTVRGTENTNISSAQCFQGRNFTDSFAGLKAHRFGLLAVINASKLCGSS